MRQIAMVTGASRKKGLGHAICLALAKQGIDICFTHWQAYDQEMPWGRDSEAPEQLKQEVESHGVRCESVIAFLSTQRA